MCIRVRLNNTPYVAFLIPKDTDSEPQLVGFHLSMPMGYVESVPLFCAATETTKDTANNTIHNRGKYPVHPQEMLTETPPVDCNCLRE